MDLQQVFVDDRTAGFQAFEIFRRMQRTALEAGLRRPLAIADFAGLH